MLTVALGLLVGLSASAQVFVLEENNNRIPSNDNFGTLDVPPVNTGEDHLMTPIGNGSLLLVALGGAYLLRKKERRQ